MKQAMKKRTWRWDEWK